MKVGIAGIGGIGSNVARHLAQAGVKSIKVVDFDKVEASNLNRQFYTISQVGEKKTTTLVENLHLIFPQMEIEAVDMEIKPGDAATLFADCSIVVEGFDDKALKKMMIEELSHVVPLVVSASGIGGRQMASIQVKKIGNCSVVGDFVSDQDEHELFPPKIAAVAARMAAIVLDQIKEETT